jgi:hypothetical protein
MVARLGLSLKSPSYGKVLFLIDGSKGPLLVVQFLKKHGIAQIPLQFEDLVDVTLYHERLVL